MASATAVDTPPLDTLDSEDTLVVSTASVRLRPSPRLRLRPIPTTDTATPELATAVDTDTLVLATTVDTPALDTPDLATTVATLDSATDTAVATDTSDKKDPIYKGFQDQRKAEPLQLNA